jgi:hypothetical protein
VDTRYHNSSDNQRLSDEEVQQQAARDAIMKIRLFPDLSVRLRKALGYGPHVDMMQHFVYWFHPRHPKMQNRRTLYKTYKEWRDECGLARKQIDKGRAKLRELGLVTEKKGPHARLHYRVDWVALADVLSLSPIGEQTQSVHQGEQSSLSPVGEQANTEDYSSRLLSGNSNYQFGGEPLSAASPPVEEISKEKKNKVYSILFGHNEASRLADKHVTGTANGNGAIPDAERVAAKAKELAGGSEPLEAYVAYVQLCLELKREELVGVP